MAEVFRYQPGDPTFSEVLAMIDRWQQEGELSAEDREQARAGLKSCERVLEDKTDLMSQMAKAKLAELLAGMD